ncbi:hypothetical protein [uncultured Chryseobacterium sp.]|uniref:hypothetical protein n=1 Tax=uncultured Chryseobacterium sp. TaxID=259322 RepID=UPI0025E58720|nr:hypothetical protein [uncultured Chryseobacterium sp.]
MDIYLDNNAFIDIEQGSLTIDDLKNKYKDENLSFYYSPAHIHESNEIKADSLALIQERLEKRFKTISSITQNNYLYQELSSNEVHKIKQIPFSIYKLINQVSFAKDSMKSMVNIVDESQKQIVREAIGLNPTEMNNYRTSDVISQINKKLDLFQGYSFLGLIEMGFELHPDGKSFGLHNKFAGVFELLDFFGYWKDKYNEKSNYARLWDSNHAFFASYCDVFISRDKRTRNKAEVAYNVFEINTKVDLI